MAEQIRVLNIDGMTCGGCVASIYSATADIDGLLTMSIELTDNQAAISYDDSKTNAETIAAAIEDAGFDVTIAQA